MSKRHTKRHTKRVSSSMSGYHQNSTTSKMCRTVTVPSNFVVQATFTASSTALYFPVLASSTFVPRIYDMFDDYQFYRVKSMKCTLYTTGSTTTAFALGYSSARSNNTPSGALFSTVTQLGCNVVLSPGKDSNCVLTIPHTQLFATPDNWFSCSYASGDSLGTQGYLSLVPSSSTTQTVFVRIDIAVQFKSPVVQNNLTDLICSLEAKISRLRTYDANNLSFTLPINSELSAVNTVIRTCNACDCCKVKI